MLDLASKERDDDVSAKRTTVELGACGGCGGRTIDVIASILPYDRYVAAETFLSLSQVPGRFGTMFQSPEQARAAINELRRAQAEGEVRCF